MIVLGKRHWMGTLLFAGFMMGTVSAQVKDKKPLQYGAQYSGKRTDSAMAKFRANRFGQFIHWGLYSIPGGVWEGKTYNYAAEFLKSSAHIATATWDSLMYQFNPTKFDAKAWAKMAKQMGVKYMTITTKHHEGFCLWPSAYTDFNISNTPFKRDLLKEVVDAYNAEGIDVNFYYSVLDWHHPDWKFDIKTAADQTQFLRYLDFAYNQLKELATRYPTVKCFWFDGTWDNSIKKNGWWTYEVEKMLKAVRPGMIVNSRLRADDYGARHRDTNGALMGDYESGYERKLPDPVKDVQVAQTDWEACMTIPENQWGYHKDWSLSYVKTPPELIEMLTLTTSLGGNFLLNFGPQSDGTFRVEEKQIAATIGDWMKVNGEAIYGGDYTGWKKQDWGYYIQKAGSSKVYMVVFNQPASGIAKIQLPEKVKITKNYLLETPGQSLLIKETQKNQYNLYLPAVKKAAPYIIVLETEQGSGQNKEYQEAKT